MNKEQKLLQKNQFSDFIVKTRTFNKIYDLDIWNGSSGPGSKIENVKPYLELLSNFIQERKVKSILDLGCGDFEIMKSLNLSTVRYLGVDTSSKIISRNKKVFPQKNLIFKHRNIVRFKPKNFDLVILKDVLQHCSNSEVSRILKNLNGTSKFVIITNDESHPTIKANIEIASGDYRPILLDSHPFSLEVEELLRFDSFGFKKRTDLLNYENMNVST
jgi:SAM-dependent methyltransferase